MTGPYNRAPKGRPCATYSCERWATTHVIGWAGLAQIQTHVCRKHAEHFETSALVVESMSGERVLLRKERVE